MRIIRDLTRRLLKMITLDDALKLVTDTALKALPGDHASIRVLDNTGTRLLSWARSGAGAGSRPMSFDGGSGVIGWVAQNRMIARIVNTAEDERFQDMGNQGFAIKSILAIPLIWDSRVLGVLGMTSGIEGSFSSEDEIVAEILANSASPAIERARLERLTITDELTMVFNQRHLFTRLEEEISRSQRSGAALNLLLLDLDEFKNVNDEFGHAAGDEVLKEFVARVKSVIRLSDVMVRRGGDEFVVIMPDFERETGVAVAQRICESINSQPFRVAVDMEIHQSVSIGIAVWNGRESAREIEKRADDAMYRAKQQGRNQVVVSTI